MTEELKAAHHLMFKIAGCARGACRAELPKNICPIWPPIILGTNQHEALRVMGVLEKDDFGAFCRAERPMVVLVANAITCRERLGPRLSASTASKAGLEGRRRQEKVEFNSPIVNNVRARNNTRRC